MSSGRACPIRLTDPITLAGRTAPARVIFGPHETNLAERRAFSAEHVAYYERRARGGAGIVVTEVASVHRLDHPYERAPLAEVSGTGWAGIVDACRPLGSLVLAGLGHSGLQGSSAWSQSALWAPSRVPDPATRELPAEMTAADIDAVIEGFRRAAAISVAADTDGVELDAGPTALLRQFLSGLTNHRADAYGADRLLLLREVLTAVRDELGTQRIVALRLSCDENAPWAGITPDAAAVWARELAPHLDLLTVVRGGLYTPETYRPDAHTPETFNDELCRGIRHAVEGAVPVVLQGSVVDPVRAAQALGGICDMVEMTRAQIADPDLVRSIRGGRRPRPCVRCNQACLVRDFRNPIVGCIGNAEAGRETRPLVRHADDPRDVMIVGGGPAGLEAARVLAERGHRVVLTERDERVGGLMSLISVGRGRADFAALTTWIESRCRALGVDIRTGTEAGATDIESAVAAGIAVVLATGGEPRSPGFPVVDESRYVTATEVLAHPDLPSGPVVVWDPAGGPIAVSVAEHLAERGAEVHYATADSIAGSRLAPTGDLVAANTRMVRADITRHLDVRVSAVDGNGVHLGCRHSNESVVVEGATLVDCAPLRPGSPGRPKALRIGDCVAPRTVRSAVEEGYELGRTL
ncbi:mycofactocin system FadH/OYE family oxidoreductase 1 [Rhodococcus sp. HNM0563]|uniref:mycofactocin system FadH/OYE family oxidoreductase 1 n=1 Tax=unclassified Rhodococcus (in: high G+C Gram-positive bacteria) TaxID=192944 RepID=UPI001469A945|nr:MULTISPECIES: mycofactocin system FadH/OYE family oxidoreductase 1 [unclassified Rhodococcus (in: high G+C Gram-positive bacteria)]MCK0093786.1 mycofactocin system FadH/OYE family oxidoreductase 1 [Rhodococcus sp. F64268]NLU64508.1 mycofactocin system FadH/OYE family oxidoreductase 1 [Rhodococcus sp. HNM0563]